MKKGLGVESTHRYAKANNKYLKNDDKNTDSSYLIYLVTNNLYGWVISQKLPVKGFKWAKDMSQFNEDFIKKYDEDCNKRYFFEVDIDYPKELFNFHKGLSFLPERKKFEKVEKLIFSTEDKE